MIVEMKMPCHGDSHSEMQISQWLKNNGDYVFKDEDLLLVDTDKASLTIPAEYSGALEILANNGDTVKVGSVICKINTDAPFLENTIQKEPLLMPTKAEQNKKTTNRIELKGMKFYAHHGLYDVERKKGGSFVVDVSFNCNATMAIKNDAIEGTVNYEEVYLIVKEEMGIPAKLIEHVAGRINERIKKEVTGIEKLLTTVYKLEAPLGGPLEHVSITLFEE